MANGRVLPGNDAKANAYTPYAFLRFGELVFSPVREPFMFSWEVRDEHGSAPVSFADANARPAGRNLTYGELFAAGKLHLTGNAAYLVPTVRRRADGEPLFANTFGPASGLLAVPAALALSAFGIDARGEHRDVWTVAKVTAALLVAGSVALVYLCAAGFTGRKSAVLLALAYGFGTCVWSISSQTLWQQTPALFFLSVGAWALLRIDPAPLRGAIAGLAFSAAFACRPTEALVLAVAALSLLSADRRSLAPFLLCAAPIVLLVAGYNAAYFGSPLTFGQITMGEHLAALKTGSSDVWQTPLWYGAAGLLLSPSRGLLIYSPVLVLAFVGAVLVWRDRRFARFRFLAAAVPLLWIPAFKWFDWWGGWSYGYRPIVDSVPLLALLAVPALESALSRSTWLRAAFFAVLAWSVLVQVLGTLAYSPLAWNAARTASGEPADVDKPEFRYRLWSFRDWQISDLALHFADRARESRSFSKAWVTQPDR